MEHYTLGHRMTPPITCDRRSGDTWPMWCGKGPHPSHFFYKSLMFISLHYIACILNPFMGTCWLHDAECSCPRLTPIP